VENRASATFQSVLIAIGLGALIIPAISMSADNLDSVTVQARDREKLKHDVNEFVATAIVQSHNNESLERWTYAPVCPLVAGVSQAQGEFMLARLSQIARAAGVAVAGEKCSPNFYVIISADPGPALKKWTQHPAVFNYETGTELRHFLGTPRPVRVWYNEGATGIDGAGMVSAILDTSSIHAKKYASADGVEPLVNRMPSQYGSRLNVSTVTKDILSVIVVVDSNKVGGINIGQLTDYIGVVGLAHVDLDKDTHEAPTILSLFRFTDDARPMGMTLWDKALLHALYSTPQKNRMQLSEMQSAALRDISSFAASNVNELKN
jgi:hypothetical protein